MTLLIRPAAPADLAALVELAAVTFPHSAPAGSDPANIEHHIASNLGPDNFRRYLTDTSCILLLADDGGRAVGYSLTVLGPAEDPEVQAALSLQPTAELSKCYVHPERFGGGLASELMTATLEAAARSGACGIWLGVSSVNDRAIRFYQKHDFRTVGKKSFMFGTVEERDFVMERALPALDVIS
ncbi:ribosomal protein S18 acetylase RimI-like enzyme [Psychromicrobium silvestre]|uniref:Ribosomal protein S18 acetylase RimI-like enzyme n=1 Tax=Psychromicrobium silvestre TaxID=1645614 RepID=A0A7Y9LTF7_9MICC|nr:GNAT family N-acetyltransferase [Psychromicrobium silvestre]NYE95304.1 ribosomal protein S18 acetylase RimI-like enzyme [Psychromicrobium silvestre]